MSQSPRRSRLPLALLLAPLLASALAVGCTDDNLVCVAEGCKPQVAPAIDDLVSLNGQFCTASPNDITYPYKVLFVVDISGSTAQSDAVGGRVPAVAAAMAQFANNTSVSFAMMDFSDTANKVVPVFTRDQAVLAAGLPALGTSNGATNYTAALQLAGDIIQADAAGLSANERSRTRYDIQWISDGVPNPCSQVPLTPNNEQAVLNLVKSQGLLGISMSTIFLTGGGDMGCDVLDPTTGVTTHTSAGDLMQAMATEGGGTFQALSGAQLHIIIDITQVFQPYDNHLFYIVNHSRVVKGAQALPDSDQDGISDADEVAAGTDPLHADAHLTGCSDMVNSTISLNPNLCAQTCAIAVPPGTATSEASFVDSDQDGLHDCEEGALGSDSGKADSDGDYLIDSLEVRFGTNFRDPATTTADTDRDGVTDAQEIVTGTNPLVAEPNRMYAYTYAPLSSVASPTPGIACFNFGVANVHLVQTLATDTTAAGDNVICLYSLHLPQNTSSSTNQPTVSRSCTTANLKSVAGALQKTPADGVIELNMQSFAPLICASGKC